LSVESGEEAGLWRARVTPCDGTFQCNSDIIIKSTFTSNCMALWVKSSLIFTTFDTNNYESNTLCLISNLQPPLCCRNSYRRNRCRRNRCRSNSCQL